MTVRNNTYGQAKLQDRMLEILKHFIKVCEENGLSYCLAAGTCLGAIRHDGFIPWDDDLDVFMPRPDYERLWSMATRINQDSQYVLCRTTKEKNYHHRVMQMVDTATTFIHTRCINENIEHGVYIDIIPLDARSSSIIGRISQIFNAIIYSIYNIQCAPEYNGGKLSKIITICSSILLKIVSKQDARYRIWKSAEKRFIACDWDSTEEAIVLTSTVRELFMPFPKTWFEPRHHVFEDIEVVIPRRAEAYCKEMYDDYMALPDERMRHARHNTAFIDLDNPYMRYKGIYYCIPTGEQNV